ncbi:MAG: type II secretion system protein [Candidatus Omnitrophota bacterium]
MHRTKGFTLIELVIVIVILAILAAVAIPKFIDMSKKAIPVQEEATIDSLKTAVLLFKAMNDYWPSEAGRDPLGNGRDLFSLLDNPPPHPIWPGDDPIGDGKTWGLRYNSTWGADGSCPISRPCCMITCPHSKKKWVYFRQETSCSHAGVFYRYSDVPH